jgi:hypothetical protein
MKMILLFSKERTFCFLRNEVSQVFEETRWHFESGRFKDPLLQGTLKVDVSKIHFSGRLWEWALQRSLKKFVNEL